MKFNAHFLNTMAASEGSSDITESYEISSMVRGYHQYRSIWNAIDGEELPCQVELSNPHDLFAVAVCKSDIVVGHVPKKYHRSARRFCGEVVLYPAK